MIKLVIDDEMLCTDLSAFQLSSYQHYVDWCPGAQYFNGVAGVEPYRLLAYLARQLSPDSLVSDCGTLYGCSAVALAANPEIEVVTYDIADHGAVGRVWPENIRFVFGDCLDHVAEITQSALVHLDIDPHNGTQEDQFFSQLVRHGFKGILVCDDIKLNFEMRQFWEGHRDGSALNQSEMKFIDATRWGHHSGTGVVVFDPETIDVEVK